ncbi:MAG: asparagine synthase (glutamine-hydrolyzing) [bacterium]
MCGICGIYSVKPVDSEHIVQMCYLLSHRGPDDEGYILFDFAKVIPLAGRDSKIQAERVYQKQANLFFGHRRLSIIDLSICGHQPMSDVDQKIWIVFNGEIYNYLELKSKLQSKGYIFKSNTDTEVIVNSYKEWGCDCVNFLDGMWAFVILDIDKKILFGSRDRTGVKPLYFFHNKDYFIFASEIKAIVKSNLYSKQINHELVLDYLLMDIEEQVPESFFRGIFQLLPSHNFILDLNTNHLKIWRYFDVQYNSNYEKFDKSKLASYSKKLKELIFEVIRSRLISDVPVGSCLSGGLDSSTIVCVINEILKGESISCIGQRQKVFSAVFPNYSIDESKWINIIVSKTNVESYKTTPSFEELIKDLEELVYYQDIPFGSTSIYAQYKVMQLASINGIKVMLDGQGGDEIFTGYHGFYESFLKEIVRNYDFFKIFNLLLNFKKVPFSYRHLWRILRKSLKHIFSFNTKHSQFKNLSNYLGTEYTFTDEAMLAIRDKLKDFWKYPVELLNEHLYKQLTLGLVNLLRYEDRNSMRFSIEARAPFSDSVKLINFMFSLPTAYKIHNGLSKYILRVALKDILPFQTINRIDKIGFQTPQNQWISNNLSFFTNLIDYEFIRNYINVDRFLAVCYKSEVDTNKIWKIINLSVWKKVFFSN